MPQRQVFFATNRKPVQGAFGIDCCDPPDTLALGVATCTAEADPVPEGRLLAGSLQLAEDPDTALAATVDKWLATARRTGAMPLLFVHGFNHDFTEALTRTAKLALWLEEGGTGPLLPLAFTWPSHGAGSGDGYAADRTAAGRSGHALAKLVATIAGAPRQGLRIGYVAHSMGVRVTRHGMQAIAPLLPSLPLPVFAQALLLAGDDECDVLDLPGDGSDESQGGLRPIADLARHVTIGVNRDDGVLWAISRLMNGVPRLGASGPRRPAQLPPGIGIVDYSMQVLASGGGTLPGSAPIPQTEAEVNWIGHQWYRNAPLVRRDLVATLAADLPPAAIPGRRAAVPDGTPTGEIAGRLYLA
jgi:esterase/lipase superfamily enzyme